MRRTGEASAFVGRDRRRGPDGAALSRVFAAGGATVLVTAVASSAFAALAGDPDSRDLLLVLDALSGFAAVGVFALCVFRWRLVGESAPLWAGTAALTTAVAVVAASHSGALRQAAQLVTLALLAASVLAPPVDTRLRPGRLLAGVNAVLAALTGVFLVAPGWGRTLAVDGITGDGPLSALPGLAVVGAWLAVACLLAHRSFQRRWLYGWAGVLAFGLLLSQLVGDLAAGTTRLAGLLVAVVGCAVELGSAYVEQRSRLFDSEVSLEASAVQQRAQTASRRVQRHDVRNAAMAIEGAAVTLERHLDQLSADDRAWLTETLATGVDRLQGLLRDERVSDTTFDVSAAVTAAVRDRGWEDRVVAAVPEGLAASGSAAQTAEVLRLLFDNAERRAPGLPVTLTAGVEGQWVVVRVHDRGPSLSRQRRRTVLDGDEGGLGVHVAGRILHEMGGDLWVEPEPAEGAIFALCLPSSSPSAASPATHAS